MIAFASMLTEPAKQAGMSVPLDKKLNDNLEGYREAYPHFYVFCTVQLGRSVPYHGVHWENAKIIAGIPAEKLLHMTLHDLEDLGFR